MTGRAVRWMFFALTTLFFVYAFIFPLLTVDTISTLLARSGIFEAENLYLLLFLEFSRLITSVVALAVVAALLARRVEPTGARSLVMFLLCALIAYEKVVGANAYPGVLQEQVATALRAAGVSQALLRWLFGPLVWPVWPAAAALLRFSVVFPRPLDPNALDASAQRDRRGFMRSSALAGADVGAFFRWLSRAALRRHGYAPAVLAAAAAVLVLAHSLLQRSPWLAALYLVGFVAVCLVATNLRAGHHQSFGTDRVRAGWITEAFVVAVFMFLASAAIFILVPTTVARMAAFVVAMLMPAAVIICFAVSVLTRASESSADIIDSTVRAGTGLLAIILAFGLMNLLFGWLAEPLGMPRALATVLALVAALSAAVPAARMADRVRLRVLERKQVPARNAG